MSVKRGVLVPLGVLVVFGATVASTVFGTTAHQYSSPAVMALASSVGALLGVAAVFGLPKKRTAGAGEWVPAALGGVAGFALAPWLVMANRYTDAPPGSEVVFLTTAAWGAMLAMALALTTRERVSRIGGALLSLAAAAALVANWERPSSFSPFVRFQREELLMLVAGALWTALILILVRAAKRNTLPSSALVAAVSGVLAAAALVLLGFVTGAIERAHFGVPGLGGYGVSSAFSVAAALIVLRAGRPGGVAAAHLLVPAGIASIIVLEQFTGPLGPQPIVVAPALASAALVALGAWVSVVPAPTAERARADRSGATWASVVAAVALVAAMVALASPAMRASVSGLRTSGATFRAAFTLVGFEAAGPWLAFGVALSVLGVALESRAARAAWSRVGALLGAAALWLLAARTPLRTLTSFIPSDVQVDYGSEYARITFAGGVGLAAALSVAGSVAALVLIAVGGARARRTRRVHERDENSRSDLL